MAEELEGDKLVVELGGVDGHKGSEKLHRIHNGFSGDFNFTETADSRSERRRKDVLELLQVGNDACDERVGLVLG